MSVFIDYPLSHQKTMALETETPYQYFRELLGDRKDVIIMSRDIYQTLGVAKESSDFVVGIYNIFGPTKHLAILHPDETVYWQCRSGSMITLSEGRARVAGRLLVRCAEAIVS